MKRKVIVYIAMSLDGYIAGVDGSVDFLQGTSKEAKGDPGYKSFYESIDTVIMGRKTYEQIVFDLSPNHWVYEDKDCLVVSKSIKGKNSHCTFVSGSMNDVIKNLRKKQGRDIWLVGGASLVDTFLKEGLIDRWIITIIPTILGQGISLFKQNDFEEKLHLKDYKEFDGMIQVIYDKRDL